jgi:murein DD-endopeptidase MepM/ murein hydrolase activator NlpD
VFIALFVWALSGVHADARTTTAALRVGVPGAPQWVRASDGREHLEYDLIITNAFTAEAQLERLVVRAGGSRLLSFSGGALAAATQQLFTLAPTNGRIASASTVVTQVDIALPRSAGRAVPAFLTNRIGYAIPANARGRALIGTTSIQMPALRVDRSAPVVIAVPLRGSGWVSTNGCCGDPTSGHRAHVVATSSGGYVTPEMFAIDWARVVNGRLYSGDGSRNSDYPTYGSALYAVANGTVVLARDNQPDIPPNSPLNTNPFLQSPEDNLGNGVILKIGPGRYACYAHMKPGSVRVRRGQRVRVGQRIGLVGNSGQTTGPHLHFGIQRQPSCLSSASEPFEIDRYTLDGTVGPVTAPPRIDVIGRPRRELGSYPLIASVATFLPPLRTRR